MEYLNFLNEFFSHIKCVHCLQYLTDNSIELVRKEESNIVIKIACSKCGKSLGLAIVGIERVKYKKREKEEIASDPSGLPVSFENKELPITYDDVIDAHNFFNNLGDDWVKYIPKASN